MTSRRIASLFVFIPFLAGADWPEFRGPTAQGIYAGKPLPTEWGPEKNITWKKLIPGEGWSSPAVVGGRVYLTAAVAKDSEYSLRAICLNAETGETVWDKEVFAESAKGSPRTHPKNSHASPSPLVAGGKLYVHFGHQGTACLDLEGNLVWQNRELKYPPVHGAGGSPILVDGKLIFSCDGGSKPFVAALFAQTGKLAWKTARSWEATKKFSFSTPIVISVKEKKQVISAGSGAVAAYDPASGTEIWQAHYGEGYSVVPRPAFGLGLVFTSSGYDSPTFFAVRVGGTGDITESDVAWTLKKNAPRNASPVLVGDELYLVSDDGRASCLNAQTGKVLWNETINGAYSSSPISDGKNVYFLSEKGLTTVVKAAKEFEVVAKNALNEKTQASMAAVDGAIYLRTENALYRIEQK